MQSGASDLTPLIFSKSSIDEPTPAEASAGFASIFTEAVTGLLTTAGATTGAPGSAGLLCKFLVYADQDLKKLDVLKQGMAHWNGLSS